MIVRPGKPTDRARLAALHAASWRSAYTGLVPDTAFGAPLDENMNLRWAIWPQDRVILVAEAQDQITGFASVVPGAPPLLDNLHVDPTSRSAGTGTALMRAVAGRLAPHGLRLEVLVPNVRARAFYTRLGGVEGPPEPDTLLGHPVQMIPVTWTPDTLAILAEQDR